MPAPSTGEELLELIRKSGVADEKRLTAYLDKVRASGTMPAEASKLAALLLRDGLLTQFQAEQFLQGRWRRFTIGKYKVLERIGSGGMGSVYLCEHKFMRRRAAVKVLPTAKANDPSALERFYREARAVAALDHPNIVRAYDIDQEDNLHFLVMEYVDGASLQEIVKKSGPLDPGRAAHYISQAALGLQHAYDVGGLVHRDIKPGNVIVDRSGQVKVLDMGLARFFNDEEDLLTKKYDENVLGTADYLAPEQVLDSHGVDIRADIYSLGATFYFCLTGRTPFSEGTVAQKLIWHQTRQPRSIRSIRPEVPEAIVAVVEKMMAKRPEERYAIPADVVRALAPSIPATIPPPPEDEMPQLSLAATSNSGPETTTNPRTPSPSRPPSSQIRRVVKPAIAAAPPAAAEAAPPTDKPVPSQESSAPTASPAETPGDRPFAISAFSPSAPAPAPMASIAEDDAESDTLVWEKLAADTGDLTAQTDTEPQQPPQRRSAVRTPVALSTAIREVVKKRLWWIVGIVGGLVILSLLLARLLGGGGHSEKSTPRGQSVQGRILKVQRGGRDGAFRTVAEALQQSKPRDHIVIQDETVDEFLDLTGRRDLTLESEGGKPVFWRFPPNQPDAPELVMLRNCEGVRIQGLVFDGRDKVDHVVVLTGNCPGLTLENVQVRGFKRFGIVIANCAGSSNRPIRLRGVQTSTLKEKEAALAFLINAKITDPKANNHFVIQECEFAGPYKTAIQPSASTGVANLDFLDNKVRLRADQPPQPLPAPKP